MIMLLGARLGGEGAVRLGQPAVLGELAAGIILGNLRLAGIEFLEPIKHAPSIEMLAGLGVLLLLFEVGLESTVAQMMRVGLSAVPVAVLGVITPFALGWLVTAWLLPGSTIYVQIFLGATLTATSVGITARVLKDLGRSSSPEARIILGAAVVDDVLGLLILATVVGIIGASSNSQAFSYFALLVIVLKATVFLAGALIVGVMATPRLFGLAAKLRGQGALLIAGLTFCLLLSWLAAVAGLAAIVGAFAAGLVLEELHSRPFVERGEKSLGELIEPLSSFLTPIFFVLMGMRTDLASFAGSQTAGLAIALTVVAIVGKQACSLGVIGGGIDRLSIGIGMIPRGEVGLIFADVGLKLSHGSHPIITDATFSAIVVMVMATTLVTPPTLKWSLNRRA
ncbi:MAG TPA: cation:proton antiporter [Candidatus Binataceae bacterium]|nr:cation:proton antiporter [Candidatus Binataceae bacterium]